MRLKDGELLSDQETGGPVSTTITFSSVYPSRSGWCSRRPAGADAMKAEGPLGGTRTDGASDPEWRFDRTAETADVQGRREHLGQQQPLIGLGDDGLAIIQDLDCHGHEILQVEAVHAALPRGEVDEGSGAGVAQATGGIGQYHGVSVESDAVGREVAEAGCQSLRWLCRCESCSMRRGGPPPHRSSAL
ncbi:hypothetical protein [Streptomyces sp. NPDC088915]|uniref:hypothetical protein n=1 Tax=Streptomyces sp. NPDC088915 TaxID=3365912 RepID=UPI003823BBCF